VSTFLLVDGNSLLHRAYHALPPLTAPDGRPTGAAYGFTSMLLKALNKFSPDYLVVAFDTRAPTFRHRQFADYKIQRPKLDKELISQIDLVKEIVDAFGFRRYEADGYEADDLIGTIVKRIQESEFKTQESRDKSQVVILTGDLDLLQLVSDRVKVYTPRKGLSNMVVYDVQRVRERYKIPPEKLVDYKALVGDTSDNIPGVKGVGSKTASHLLSLYRDLFDIYNHLDKIPGRWRAKLSSCREKALLSRELAYIRRNVDFPFSLKQCLVPQIRLNKIKKLFENLGFHSLFKRVSLGVGEAVAKQGELFVSSASRREGSVYPTAVSFKSREVSFLAREEADEFCLALCDGYRVSVYPDVPAEARALFNNEEVEKIALDAKEQIKLLSGRGVLVKPPLFDPRIAVGLLGRGEKWEETGSRKEETAVQSVRKVFELKKKLQAKLDLEENRQEKELFYFLEMPLVFVLLAMEQRGIEVDRSFLTRLGKELGERIAKTEKMIYEMVGEEINLNSPRQLEEILFDKLKLSSFKRTPTRQRSTDESVLKKLKGSHPVIEKILKYRWLFKLKSTYVDSILERLGADGRVHPTFNQARTATGRLSCQDPNLQNIPRGGRGGYLGMEENVRKAFIAPEGYKLLSADYSQIELRLVAHFSKDERLLASFEKDQDIHTATAARIFNCFVGDVTPNQRHVAKTVNFGVIYGMSAYGLSEELGIDQHRAKRFIDQYFNQYPRVKKFGEEKIEEARRYGFVKTLWGRKRNIPDINSPRDYIRSGAERMAVNHPVQGTAADLIKKAMVEIADLLTKFNSRSKNRSSLILQIHDELLFEVPQDQVRELAKKVKGVMESVADLAVPLKVDLTVGDNWGEMKLLEE